ncbi:hypothetical protein ACVW2L_000805 [Mucilaginibacter sp. HD30]
MASKVDDFIQQHLSYIVKIKPLAYTFILH